jgi:gamma-glutamyltranspeptidase
MKTFLGPLLVILLFGFGCSSDGGDGGNSSNDDFSGSYRGTVVDAINGQYHATLNDYAILLTPTNTSGQVTISNSLLLTNTANIVQTNFTIPTTVATQNATIKAVEWAVGQFEGANNETLAVVFYQNHVNVNTGETISTLTRTCVLAKQ